MIEVVILVILLLFLIGALPRWNYSRNWGYAPTGLLSTILIVFLVLLLLRAI